MKEILLIILVSIFILSCSSSDKIYSYIEKNKIWQGPNEEYVIKDYDTVFFMAISDSAAYIEAYERFCIAVRILEESRVEYDELAYMRSTPLSFRLMTESQKDIANLSFINKDSILQSIEMRICNHRLEWSIENTVIINEGIKPNPNIDSVIIKKLSPLFNIKKDEFSESKRSWYTHKTAPKYLNSNDIYCYFSINNNRPSNIRLKFQYAAEDWLFIEKLTFSIDEEVYVYIPKEMETNHNSTIWEWFDEPINNQSKQIVNALISCKQAKVKLSGSQYSKIKNISEKQLNSIRNTVELYKAMGGDY